MTRHIKLVHEEKKSFECRICDKRFTMKQTMKIHVASVHESKKTFKCEICDKDFSH